MALVFRTSSISNAGPTTIKNSALSYEEGDGNFAYLLTNMSGSNINISGDTLLTGQLQLDGNVFLPQITSASQNNILTYNTSSGRIYYTSSNNFAAASDLNSYVTTASFTAFTSSYNTGSFSGSFIGELIGTSSWAISASWAPSAATPTGSLLTTASVSNNTITFTKGDASQFSITVATGSGGSGGSIATGSFITTGSATAVQRISGSLQISSSLGVTGSIVATNIYGTRVGGAMIGNSVGPNYLDLSQIDAESNGAYLMTPYLHEYFFINGGSNSIGGKSYSSNDAALGYYYLNPSTLEYNLPAIYFTKTSFNGPGIKYATVISDNSTTSIGNFIDLNGGLANAKYKHNNRTHVLTVTGSFLARDGVSLGTNINNTHFITGSVNATGSLFLRGLTSASQTDVLTYNSSTGQVFFTASSAIGGGGSGTPGGSDTEIQFNSGSTFSGDAAFRFIYASQSLEQGQNVQAIGLYSHAEGEVTKTGTLNAYSASISASVVTLIGNVSGEFFAGNYLYAYRQSNGNKYNYTISSSVYNGTNTIVTTFEDDGWNNEQFYVGDLFLGIPNWSGNQTISGVYSHAEGYYTIALGINSHAEGDYAWALGDYSHVEGQQTITIGRGSHTEGYQTYALGGWSHAEGNNTKAIGEGSHTEGETTQAIGNFSHTEGSNTQAIGNFSHAEGLSTIASGLYSHAEGESTIAVGRASHASGYSTIASSSYQTVVGIHNATSSIESAFIVGNGSPEGGENGRRNLLFAGGTSVIVTGSFSVSGSATLPNILTLPYQHPLPNLLPTGSIALSGSGATFVGMFVFTGAWTQI